MSTSCLAYKSCLEQRLLALKLLRQLGQILARRPRRPGVPLPTPLALPACTGSIYRVDCEYAINLLKNISDNLQW